MGNNTGVVLSMNATRNELEGNTISGNHGNGVTMSGNGVYSNSVIFNSIYLNDDLVLDLNNDGPTANDPGDNDNGSNLSQNYPVLINAFLNSRGKVEVEGSLDSEPNKSYTIYFYASRICNSLPGGQNLGDGEEQIGYLEVSTTSNGEVSFLTELSGVTAPGRHITAIAVDENNNTSEFSSCISIPNWPSLGFGLNDEVRAIVMDANGTLYAGGDFTLAGNTPISYLAKWDGITWSEVGGGTNAPVYTLHFDQNGDLLVGGDFTLVNDSISANRIAKWDGSSWSSFGLGMNDRVRTITTSSSGTIYAGGDFTSADGNTQIKGIARWNNIQWVSLPGATIHNIQTIIVTPDAEVIAGGNFSIPPNIYDIAKWNGANWTGLFTSGAPGVVNALALKSNGYIYAADGGYLLEYDGISWSTLHSSAGTIKCLKFDENENLYLGGQFTFSVGQGYFAKNLAIWDGSNFDAIGGGVEYNSANSIIINENDFYVGGKFELANGVPADNIAQFWIDYALSRSNELNKVDSLEYKNNLTEIDIKIYPNPFSSIVNVDYSLPEDSDITIEIFDINGQLVKLLFQGYLSQGTYSTLWDGRSSSGNQLMSGLYFCSIKTNFSSKTYKLFLSK